MDKLTERFRTCICGREFSYQVGRGTDRKYCSVKCRTEYEKSTLKSRRKIKRALVCNTPNCGKLVDRPTYGLCEACYYQQRRTGSVVRQGVKFRAVKKDGYVRLILPQHPLAISAGYVLEHRKVLYDRYGPGVHPCFWCGNTLEWKDIVGDHLNEIKEDNSPENLVISCNKCNRLRGGMIGFFKCLRPEALPIFLKCMEGWIIPFVKEPPVFQTLPFS